MAEDFGRRIGAAVNDLGTTAEIGFEYAPALGRKVRLDDDAARRVRKVNQGVADHRLAHEAAANRYGETVASDPESESQPINRVAVERDLVDLAESHARK